MASSDVFDNLDLPEDSPPRPQRSHKKTWQELRSVVRETRRSVTKLSPSIPSNFEFRDYEDDAGNVVTRLYFLGSMDRGRDSTLLRADLKDPDEGHIFESMMLDHSHHHNHHHQQQQPPQSQQSHPQQQQPPFHTATMGTATATAVPPYSALQHRLAADNSSHSNHRNGNNSMGGESSSNRPHLLLNHRLLPIEPVFSSQPSASSSSSSSSTMSKEEILMRERKRLMSYGITSYDYSHDDKVFVLPAQNSLYVCSDDIDLPCVPMELPTQTYGARLDPKICPCNSDLVAFVHEADIWVAVRSAAKEFRLTHAHRGCVGMEDDPVSAGSPSFVIQEEFDRYTGYWWSPRFDRMADGRQVYRILYEEVDESNVEVLSIFSPTGSGSTTDNIRYPKAGGNNAVSNLKMAEITVNYNSGTTGDAGPKVTFRECAMVETLFSQVPWAEYLTRAGWTADGKYVYSILLSRLQTRQALVLISPDSFLPSQASVYPSTPMMHHPPSSVSPPSSSSSTTHHPLPVLHWVYQETSNVWINVHDCLHFFPQTSPDHISFLFASEKSGFRHLYYVTSSLILNNHQQQQQQRQPQTALDDSGMEAQEESYADEDAFPMPDSTVIEQWAVTQGAWVVLPKELWVDESRGLVFFMGLKDTPLESHLYVTRYDQPGTPITRLTTLGYYHSVQMSKDCTKFVSVFSSLECPPQCQVFSVLGNAQQGVSGCTCIGALSPPVDTLGYIPPTPFQYLSQAGHTAYGLYLRPHGLEEGRRYPTVLFVYGGPQVQMVTNSFKGQKFLRLHALAAEGYMVVVIDGRGSTNRGLHFEGCLKHKLGTLEINDQIEGLLWLTSKTNCIDLSRVAIHGWSYGGYLALMGLTQRRDIFKVAIAGAPVVDWELYDTGYTERYLGLPHHNPDAYKNGSVLSYIDLIPESDTRLLLIHGLIDENVHFNHSSVLINSMVSAFKPIQLQVYPNERHGIRSHDAIEHYKTTVLKFLQDHL